jgi:hypothetical protein
MDRTPASSPSLKMVASSGSTLVGNRRASTDTTARHGANGGGVNWIGTPPVAFHSRGYNSDTWWSRSRHARNPVNEGRGTSLTDGRLRSGIGRVYGREAGLQYEPNDAGTNPIRSGFASQFANRYLAFRT